MGEGLFFWLILIGVAVLQGIGQKKRKPGQGLPGSKPRGRRPPTRDRPRIPEPDPEGANLSSDDGTSSEDRIPADVWEEILGLARGTPGGRKAPRAPAEETEDTPSLVVEDAAPRERERSVSREREPRRDSPSPVVSRSERVPVVREFPQSHGANAVLHDTKAALATSGLGAPRDLEDRDGESSSASVRAELFGGGTLKELRKAIVHQEVLGTPVALREDR